MQRRHRAERQGARELCLPPSFHRLTLQPEANNHPSSAGVRLMQQHTFMLLESERRSCLWSNTVQLWGVLIPALTFSRRNTENKNRFKWILRKPFSEGEARSVWRDSKRLPEEEVWLDEEDPLYQITVWWESGPPLITALGVLQPLVDQLVSESRKCSRLVITCWGSL